MADIGSASLLIVPRFDNLSASIDKALGSAAQPATNRGKSIGESTGKGFSTGLATSGAAIGAFSALAGRAFDSIASHIGSAISRFDTLNQYPKTMELLGYSAEEAETSIQKMSDRLSTLPTRLDAMTSMVQGIVAITGDLEQATDAGLALNDMLVASGSNQQLVTAAMEQFRQMLAKGKPEMEDWKSLTAAMPGQMQQLAEAMLGPTANANDLYAALGGGKNDPTITMDQLLDKMIELDTVGGSSITSFKEQAETAAGGIQTAMANASNAVTKGLANTLDAIGRENIAGVFNDIKGAINDAFGIVNPVIEQAVPIVKGLYDALKPLVPLIAGAAAGFMAWKGASGILSSVSGVAGGFITTLTGVGEAIALTAGGAGTLTESLAAVGIGINPVTAAVGALAAIAGVAAVAFSDWQEKSENMEAATQGLSDAVSDTTSLDTYSGKIKDVGTQAEFSAMSVDELAESTAAHVETMEQNNEKAQETIATLSTAQGILNQYAGQTDLSAQAQGRLEWALETLNEQLGLNISQQDVMNGQYTDADGNVQDLTESINNLVEAKKREAQAAALTANLTEAYQVQADAAKTLAASQKDYNDQVQEYIDQGMSEETAKDAAYYHTEEGRALQSATEQYDAATDAVTSLEGELGIMTRASSEAADAFDVWAASVSPAFSQQLGAYGTSIASLTEDLRSLGADTTKLGTLSADQLNQLAITYDGTMGSIVGLLQEWGVSMDEAAVKAVEMAEEVMDVFDDFGPDFADALEGIGVDLDTFAQQLANAGVQTSTLREVGSENIAALAEACNGDIGAMTFALQNWNDLPFVSKDGTVTVQDGQLVDAQGRIYVWNGTEFVPKETTAEVFGNGADGSAQTNINNTSDAMRNMPPYTESQVNVTGNYADALPIVQGLASALSRVPKTVTSIVKQSIQQVKNAKGGIRPHADGGIVPRYHAGGAIATKAVPLDIVGEDGAEAIVPLTNRKYSEPFAEIIAEQVEDKRAQNPTVVNQTVNFNQPVQSPYQMRRAVKHYMTYGLAGAR